MKKNLYASFSAFLFCLAFTPDTIQACTRVMYHGTNGNVITARSMDWVDEIPANLWIFPRGIERDGAAGSNSVRWKSKYGSVVTSSWDIASSDGMNEAGLAGNMLWLAESVYPSFTRNTATQGLSISYWLQYALDNFATVNEAVAELSKENFVVVSTHIPGTKKFVTVHLSLSDKNGDNAIFEYIDGKLVIHHDKSYTTMTNSPVFSEQIAINAYWKTIPGAIMLPGTNRAADRFVRASYYMASIPKTDDVKIAVPSVFSVIRNCSVPYGISNPDEPNIASTRWRTVADQKNMVYYFENVLTPNVVWVDFSKVDFKEKAGVKKLSLADNENYAGESTKNFKPSTSFQFIGIE